MNQAYELDYWASTLLTEVDRYRRPSLRFWQSLSIGLTSYSQAANDEAPKPLLTIKDKQDDFIVVAFDRYELRVLADHRRGRIDYSIADASLRKLADEDTSVIVERGHFSIDPNETLPNQKVTGTKDFKPVQNWPAVQQLAEFLIFRLVAPEFVDDRLV